ncbi:hypothetical protein QE374_001924 [Microbacterium sp. SORGH_AS428]|uniref:hypothetical protein n=1 Tax=Microbacterium sp. SORGH_AS_0428 TaxID=3041788 RepID=UPI00285963A6|nr:hypothetical protein [Microbacterium sp. SORGH_AS_0428]MDR6200015.1 hypothetical protein [Microbacterium sp. SORGH_AS_0428]
MDAVSPAVPAWLRVVVWSLALELAVLGVALALAAASWWPLVALLGLAVPLLPIPRRTATDR